MVIVIIERLSAHLDDWPPSSALTLFFWVIWPVKVVLFELAA